MTPWQRQLAHIGQGLGLALIIGLGTLGTATAQTSVGGIDANDILPPDQAFKVSAKTAPDGTVSLTWNIADGYYLYRKRFALSPKTPNLELGTAHFPAGKMKDDEFFGPMEIYRGTFVVPIDIQRLPASLSTNSRLAIVARMQGCADMGICFPPNEAQVSFAAAAVRVAGQAALDNAAPMLRAATANTTAANGGNDLFARIGSPSTTGATIGQGFQPQSSTANPLAAPTGEALASEALASALQNAIGDDGQKFLAPDQAFIPSVRRLDDDTVQVRFDIAQDYYLYRAKLTFAVHTEASSSKGLITPTAGAPQALAKPPAGAGAPAAITLANIDLPAGEVKDDDYFGRVETYRNVLQSTLRVGARKEPSAQDSAYATVAASTFNVAPGPANAAANSHGPLVLTLGYQGCADAGLCYPPIVKKLVIPPAPGRAPDQAPDKPPVALTVAGAGSSTSGGASNGLTVSATAAPSVVMASAGVSSSALGQDSAYSGELSETDRIVATLSGGNIWLIVGAFYVFGLLLAFTPCVLPMVPILSSILVGNGDAQGTRSSQSLFLLSLVYVLAMALTYAAAGVITAYFGENLQILFQHPVALISFSIIFVALAAAMFGLYELQLPNAWQSKLASLSSRQAGGSYVGSGVMGFFSALIVGPCVAAPLAGALFYIGKTGDTALGGIALFTLALGMGTPLLIIGASAGSLLPRVGPWMETIKCVFGFVLLGVAIYLLERIIPAPASLGLWALLLIVGAVYMGALDALDGTATGWQRLWKGTGLGVLIYGVLLVIGAASGGNDVFRPLAGVSAGTSTATHEMAFQPVKGPQGLRVALERARTDGRPSMLDYYADWCVSCKELEKYTFTDAAVQKALTGVQLLRTDVTANDDEDSALLKQFGLFGPPAILFFDAQGNELRAFRVIGYMDATAFEAHAQRALNVSALAQK
jgi:thiol:disulfide interchange protein DsbD